LQYALPEESLEWKVAGLLARGMIPMGHYEEPISHSGRGPNVPSAREMREL
jgi:hypothetical protein